MDINLGPLGFVDMGNYDATLAYAKRSIVTYFGTTYRCITATAAGQDPVTTLGSKWLITAKGVVDVYTAKGDLVTYDGTKPAKFGIGANGQILTVANGTLGWSLPTIRPGTVVAKLPDSGFNGPSMCCYSSPPVIMADGRVKQWGQSTQYCNGDPTNNNLTDPQNIVFDPNYPPVLPFVQTCMMYSTSYALDSAGKVYSWGYNGQGQLGQGDTNSRGLAYCISWFVGQGISISKIVIGRENGTNNNGCCAWFLTTTGLVYAVGYNGYGQLGNGTTNNSYTPVRCGTLTNIVGIYPGAMDMAAVFAISSTGQLYAWGMNNSGQLGVGDTSQRSGPVPLGITNAKKVVSTWGYNGGSYYGMTAVLCADNSIWTCGYNDFGNLGLGDTTQRSGFIKLSISGWIPADIEVWGGYYAFMFVTSTAGNLYSCGYNGYGQLGAVLRARYCDAKIQGITKTDGLTWKVKEIVELVKAKAKK